MSGEIGTAPSMAMKALQTAPGRYFARLGQAIEARLDAEREQLPLWVPVALGVGIAAWFALPGRDAWIAFMLTAVALTLCGARLPTGGRLARVVISLGLLAALGCALIWWRAERVAAPRLERPIVAAFVARVDAVERLPARDSIRVRLAPIDAPALPPRIRVNIVESDAPPLLAPGQRIELRARLMPPPPAAVPGAYDFARVAWFQGLGATGRALGPVRIVGMEDGGFRTWLGSLRARLSAHIQRRSPDSEGGVAAALATGDQGGISEADAEAMRRSGLAHLLSVSGLHVTAVVAGAMLLVLRLLALSPFLALRAPLLLIAAAAGALAAVSYTLLTGAEVPTVRSCIAALIVLLGIAIGRDAITLRLVATGALIVLLLWPESLAGASFQLSFAAVAAIVAVHEQPRIRALLGRRYEAWTARLARLLLGALITGLAVEIALAPIALFHFHRAGLYGAIANIVAIPLTTFVIMPIEGLALLFDIVGLGAPFWWLATRALSLLLGIAHVVSAAPGAVAALPSMPWSAFALMIVGGLWITLWRTRMRRLGLGPLAAGALWAIATPPPDLLITGDGRHLALRTSSGALGLLRPRAGDYIRDTLAENAGSEAEALALDALPGARCGPDLCSAELADGTRTWRMLATRSPYLVEIGAMNRACAEADIVVSERRLPRGCRPRWLKIDRDYLARSGGLAIRLSGGEVDSVARRTARHPWGQATP